MALLPTGEGWKFGYESPVPIKYNASPPALDDTKFMETRFTYKIFSPLDDENFPCKQSMLIFWMISRSWASFESRSSLELLLFPFPIFFLGAGYTQAICSLAHLEQVGNSLLQLTERAIRKYYAGLSKEYSENMYICLSPSEDGCTYLCMYC